MPALRRFFALSAMGSLSAKCVCDKPSSVCDKPSSAYSRNFKCVCDKPSSCDNTFAEVVVMPSLVENAMPGVGGNIDDSQASPNSTMESWPVASPFSSPGTASSSMSPPREGYQTPCRSGVNSSPNHDNVSIEASMDEARGRCS